MSYSYGVIVEVIVRAEERNIINNRKAFSQYFKKDYFTRKSEKHVYELVVFCFDAIYSKKDQDSPLFYASHGFLSKFSTIILFINLFCDSFNLPVLDFM